MNTLTKLKLVIFYMTVKKYVFGKLSSHDEERLVKAFNDCNFEIVIPLTNRGVK